MKAHPHSLIEPLEARIAPASAIVTFVGGVVTYTTGGGVANVVSLSDVGGKYLLTDTAENIALGTGASGFTGGGTHTISISVASFIVTEFNFQLGDLSDTFTLGSGALPKVTADGQAGTDTFTVGSAAGLTGSGRFSFETANVNAGISSAGDITISADNMTIGAAISSALVTLQPLTAGTLINLGGGDSVGQLGLTSTELDFVTTAHLVVGSMTSGDLGVTSGIKPLNTNFLSVRSGGKIIDSHANGDFVVSKLSLQAISGIASSSGSIGIAASNFEAETETGGLFVTNSNAGAAITIGGVDAELVGLFVLTSGELRFSTNGNLILADTSAPQNNIHGGTTSGDVNLSATGANSDVTLAVNGDSISAPHGNLSVTAGRDILFGTSGAGTISNSVKASGSLTLTATRDVIASGQSLVVQSDAFSLATGGNLTLTAGRNVTIAASGAGTSTQVSSGGFAGADVIVNTGVNGTLSIASGTGLSASLRSGSGDLTVSADDIALSGNFALSVVTGHTVTLQPFSAGYGVDLGSVSDAAANTVNLSDAELDGIVADPLRIATKTTGVLSVSAPISRTDNDPFQLVADNMSINAALSSPRLELMPLTASRPIDLGTETAGKLSLTAAELAQITIGVNQSLTIGGGTGSLTVSAPIALTGVGKLILSADTMALNAAVNLTTGKVVLRPANLALGIDLGTKTAGKLGLTDAELDRITASTLQIGADFGDGAAITVSAAVSPALTSKLALITGAGISGAGSLVVANLFLDALDSVTLSGSNDVTNLTARVAQNPGTAFAFTDIDDLHLASLFEIDGIDTGATSTTTLNAGSTNQAAGADIHTSRLVLAGAGPFSLTSPTNNVVSIEGSVAGGISFTDANALELRGLVTTGGGLEITTINGSITVSDVLSGVDLTSNQSFVHLTAGGSGSSINVLANSGITAVDGIKLKADQMTIAAPLNAIDSGFLAGVTLQPFTATTLVNLGAADAPGTLGLTDAELDFATGFSLQIIGPSGITVSAPISPALAGAFILQADTMAINAAVSFPASTVILQPATVAIDLGSETSGKLSLTDVELDRITAGNLFIESLSSTSITVSSAISPSGAALLTLTSNTMAIDAAVSLPAGAVSLQPFNVNQPIDLGTETAGKLSFTDAELDQITTPTLRIGETFVGTITISAAISPAHVSTLALLSSADIAETTGTITVAKLAVTARNGVSLGGANDVNSLAARISGTSFGDDFSFTDIDDLKLDLVDGVSGISGSTFLGGKITLNAGSTMQASGANLTGSDLKLLGAGPYDLTNPGNHMVNIRGPGPGIQIGAVSYTDADALMVQATIVGSPPTFTTASFLSTGAIVLSTVNGSLTLNPGAAMSGTSVQLTAGGAGSVLTTSGLSIGTFNPIISTSGSLSLTADKIAFNSQGFGVSPISAGTATIRPFTAGTLIDLGGADAAGTLGLSDAELDAITAGTLTIGNQAGSSIAITAPISPALATALDLVADGISIGAAINLATKTVTLRPFTAGAAMNLGTEVAGKLSLTDAELDLVTAGRLILGSTTSGSITVSAAIAPALTSFLSLRAGGQITDANTTGADLTATSLSLQATFAIATSGDRIEISTTNLEAATGTGGIFLSNSGSVLHLGGVTSELSGIQTFAGDIVLTNDASIIRSSENVFAFTGGILLQATGAGANIENSGGTISTFSGNVTLSAGQDILLSGAGTQTFAGSVALTAGRDITLDLGAIAAAGGSGTFTGNAGRNFSLLATTAATGARVATTGGALNITTGIDGIFTATSGANGGVFSNAAASDDGNLTIAADQFLISNTITAGTATVTLRPATAGHVIDLGGADSPTAAGIDTTEFALLTGSKVIVGSDTGGDVAITVPFTLGANANLELRSGALIRSSLASPVVTGGTLTLGSGKLDPSGGGVFGIFAATTSVVFAPGATFRPELGGTTAGTTHDQLAVTGTVDLGNAALVIAPSFTAQAGDSFTLIANDGSDAVTGTFGGLPQNALLASGDTVFRINYAGGDGNDVVLDFFGTTTPPTLTNKNKTATFTDPDGDLVSIKLSKGAFLPGDFHLIPTGTPGRQQLQLIDLHAHTDLSGAAITVTVKPKTGNGSADLGYIDATGINLGAVTIAGDLGRIDAGAVTSLTAKTFGVAGLNAQAPGGNFTSHFTGKLGKLTSKGDVQGATFTGTGTIGAVSIAGSFIGGKISAGADLGAVSVKGDITGTADTPVVISAFGKAVAPARGIDLAIKSLNVTQGVEFLRLLAGYDTSGVAKNSDASIGAITVGKDWRASTALAGVEAADDTFEGTNDDRTILASTRNNTAIVSQIAAITIKGQAFGTAGSATDNFGIVAEQIASAKIGTTKFKFAKGPRSPGDVFAIGANVSPVVGETSDFTIRENVL